MARNSRLAAVMMATLPTRELKAAIAADAVSKADLAIINVMRGHGGATEVIANHIGEKVLRDRNVRKVGRIIGQYAYERAGRLLQETKSMNQIEKKIERSRHEVDALRKAVRDNQASHPGRSRTDALAAVIHKLGVDQDGDLVPMAKLGGGNLPTPRPGTMHRTHNDSAPVLGRTGYDASVDDRPPGTAHASGGPQSGADINPIIRDHHQLLEDIKNGKVNETDPKFRALRTLEMKRLYEKG